MKKSSLALALSFASNLVFFADVQAAGVNSSSDMSELSNVTIRGVPNQEMQYLRQWELLLQNK